MKLEISIDLSRAEQEGGADEMCIQSGVALGKIAKVIDESLNPREDFDKYQNVKDSAGNIIGTWRLK